MAESFSFVCTESTEMRESAPTVNLEGDTQHIQGHATKTDERRCLLRADFSSDIPSGATVAWANLNLGCDNIYNVGQTAVYKGFETAEVWIVTQATWNDRITDTAWGAAGGTVEGAPITPGFNVDGFPGWYTADFTDFLQHMLDYNGAEFDCTLRCTNIPGSGDVLMFELNGVRYFEGYRPYIDGEYTTEEPPAASILKISGVEWANVKQVSGVAEASVSKVSGVTAN